MSLYALRYCRRPSAGHLLAVVTDLHPCGPGSGCRIVPGVADRRNLLLIFAGLLFAAFLDACTRGLAFVVPIARPWRLAIVCVLLALGSAWLLAWSSYSLIGQADSLVRLIGEQLRVLRGELRSLGITPPPGAEGPHTLGQLLLPDPGVLFGHAYTAFNLATGLLGTAVVVIFIGLFAAADPEATEGAR